MTLIKKNLLANLSGKVWVALLSLFSLPYFIHILGMEAYGLVGVYVTLTSLAQLFDVGLCTTMNREIARLTIEKGSIAECRNLTRTVEWIYWMVALMIATLLILLSPFLSSSWIKIEELSPQTATQALSYLGLALAFQWPGALYMGGLMGLQKHLLLNLVLMSMATLRTCGMVFVLTYLSPTIEAFFLWQMITNSIQTGAMAFFFWSHLRVESHAPRFDFSILKRIKGFALKTGATTLLATLGSQLDKMVLSKMLSLKMFGYYSLATTVGGALYYVIGSIHSTFFPRLSQLVGIEDTKEIRYTYHLASQIMAVATIPAALILVFFSQEILFAWTGNQETAHALSLLVPFLTLGVLFNGLLTLPYALQLAYGWPELALYQCLIVVSLQVPLLTLGVIYYGATGAAFLSLALNFLLLFVTVPLMHHKILPGEKRKWYAQGVARPLLLSTLLSLAGKWLLSMISSDSVTQLLAIGLLFSLSLIGAATAAPLVRKKIVRVFFKQYEENVHGDL